MIGDTWIDSSYEGEIARCIPGSHLKVIIGEVLQSDQGLAGTYDHGQVLMCGEHEALRHFKDGMVKCAPAIPVPDCTERTNLRRYGEGDFFFSYRAQVCVTSTTTADAGTEAAEVSGMSLDGGRRRNLGILNDPALRRPENKAFTGSPSRVPRGGEPAFQAFLKPDGRCCGRNPRPARSCRHSFRCFATARI